MSAVLPVGGAQAPVTVAPLVRSEGVWRAAWRRLRSDRLGMVSLCIVAFFIVLIVLAATGLVARDGSSRKRDHDQINVMLNRVVEPLVTEAAARFDPGIAFVPTPYGVGYTGLMQMLVAWRETAWRQAERLVAAPDAAARNRVARQIETYAETNAQAIVTATAYQPPVTTTAARDAYCAINGNP